MDEIILTGYDEKQFGSILKRKGKAGCYLCKRPRESVYMLSSKEGPNIGTEDLRLDWFEVLTDKRAFKFPICHECHMLLKSFVEKILFDKEFGSQLNNSKETED